MTDRQMLALSIFLVMIVFLLSEIAHSLTNAKIVLAIREPLYKVIEGEAREVKS